MPDSDNVTLYQFALCPFCNKVQAALEVTGVPYSAVEVSPRNKKELPPLPEGAPKKVPVLTVGDQTLFDSTTILQFIADRYQHAYSYSLEDEVEEKRSSEIEAWVDDEFIQALPTVIYGTWKEAAQAAQVIARAGRFGTFQGLGVKLGGSVVMHMVAKRILKRAGRKDGHGWVRESLDQFETWLADKPFVVGEKLSGSDVAMHGALSCVRDFPIFKEVMDRDRVRAWYERVQAIRDDNRAA